MGEERKEACLLCLPRDLALCVAFFSFYQLPRKETSGRREPRPLFAEERFRAACSLLTDRQHEMETELARRLLLHH